ncbi:Ionotropic receptor 173 [Frankliniella occidentalis]|nr:Ionotropic receptor 173 [Frankliniella occidentalis]
METILALCLICCAWPGVRADLSVVGSVAPSEARSAAALLAPFLTSQAATLLVTGETPWTGTFLRELPADTPRVLNPSSHAMNLRLEFVLSATHCAHFFHTDDLETLLYTMGGHDPTTMTRALFWVNEARPRDEVLRLVSQSGMWLGGQQYALALAAPNGSATLFNLTCSSEAACRTRTMTLIEVDEWSPVEQRWRRGAQVFHEFCAWREGQVPAVLMLTMRSATFTTSIMELTKSVVVLARRRHRQRSGSTTAVSYHEVVGYHRINIAAKECSLGAVLSDVPLTVLGKSAEIASVHDMEMHRVVVVVPAGFGASVGVLEPVTVEFSAALWCATGLAVLCTVIVLTCTCRQDVSGAVLQALAPMLGQPPPQPSPPRTMLAPWLLACVVLTAAYQGLLLAKVSSAVPRRELDSLRDVADSGLPLYALGNLVRSSVLPTDLAARTRWIHYLQTEAVIDTIATARNCALVTYLDGYTTRTLHRHLVPPKRLHLVHLQYADFKVIGLATRGSPLEPLMVTALARAEAAGLLARWRGAEYEREDHDYARKLAPLKGPRPLTLWQLRPAFVVLGVGQVAGVAAFALEVLCALSSTTRTRVSFRRTAWS